MRVAIVEANMNGTQHSYPNGVYVKIIASIFKDISTTFDKYCYVIVRHLPRFFEYSTELSYSKIERVTSIDDIEHPAIRNAMKMLDMHELRLTYEADLPARSGLGTSSSFAVGMLNAFYALKGKYVDKKKLADDAIYLERVSSHHQVQVPDLYFFYFGQ